MLAVLTLSYGYPGLPTQLYFIQATNSIRQTRALDVDVLDEQVRCLADATVMDGWMGYITTARADAFICQGKGLG